MQLSSFLPNKFTAPPGVADITALLKRASERESCLLNEYEVYDVFTHIGVSLPEYAYVPMGEDAAQALSADKKYVAKASIPGCIHKTDIGGISFNVTKDTAMDVMTDMHTRLSPEWNLEGVLFTEMTAFHTKGMSNGEILISAYDDPAFGPCLAFGSGGTTVEYLKGVMRPNKSALFLPVSLNLRDKHIRGMIEVCVYTV
ncbi:hypothetical protein KIPB_012133 [Kipferlia bialata]|uniref:Uncharacterized protein n=1 Tax=Kipferlia bialata TaxID=797122 RepID=A0A9K3GNP3_9EUKA|nr:hypothetical protein KIPB_012133 [Kipferlia bialata]|eukprot:g12133.t1